MAKLFQRFIRSRERDDVTDNERFARMTGVLEEVIASTRREYDGLVLRIRDLSTQQADEDIYALKPASDAEKANSQLSEQLNYAVERTRKLLKQMEIEETVLASLRKGRQDGLL